MPAVRALPIYEKQAMFRRERKAHINAFIGGRGTGKTHIGAQDVLLSAKAGEPWVCVSPDNNVIRETTFPTDIDIARKAEQLLKTHFRPCRGSRSERSTAG